MNILLKSFLILCVVAASTAEEPPQEATDVPSNTDPAPETTITTEFTTPAPEETTDTATTDVPSNTDPATETTITPGPEETTDTATTDVPSSTDPATETTITPGPEETTDTATTDVPTSTDPVTETTITPAPEETTDTGITTDVPSSTAPEETTSADPATTTTSTTATTTLGPCASNPCIGDSTCEERFEGFVCFCRPGLVYEENKGCAENKIFPGSLTLDRNFTDEMNDRTSQQFHKISNEIQNALKNVLTGNGYIGSTVSRLRRGSIIADVQNFYDLTSSATSGDIERQIEMGIRNHLDNFDGFTRVRICETGYCDTTTTACTDSDTGNATCTCKEGYISSPFTAQSCFSCPNGKRATNDKCEDCPFGFAGFNCSDPYLLVVVVVSSVLGSLLIIFMLALIVVSCRNQKGSSTPEVDFSSNYGNKDLHKPTGVPRIPRANPDASWKSNSLEMTDSGSKQALVTRDRPQSKLNGFDHYEDVNYRNQGSSVYSSYDRRGVQNGGVQNPYFRQDDDRMRRY